MTRPSLHGRIEQFQPKLHGLAAGMTLSIGGLLFGQGCPLLGQCPSCAACTVRLPLLALPLLADGLVLLLGKALKRRALAGEKATVLDEAA